MMVFKDIGVGRALHVDRSGRMYIGRGYSVWSSDDDGVSWSCVAIVPTEWKHRAGQYSRIAARLFRYEIRALAVLSNGSLVISSRHGMYYSPPETQETFPSAIDHEGQLPFLPMTMGVGPDDVVVWGEYNSTKGHGTPVRIYASQDAGRNFHVVHTFAARSVLHVHSVTFDPILRHYWVFCGDFDEEPGIGILSGDFKNFDWLCKGEQRFRACEAFDFGDRLVYATDTPLAPNQVLSLDKRMGKVERLQSVSGSCLYAARFGDVCAFSTTAEPAAVDGHTTPSLWISVDGDRFEKVLVTRKDRWPYIFQFGSLVLPRGHSDRMNLFFSGQAVQEFDGRLVAGRLVAHGAQG